MNLTKILPTFAAVVVLSACAKDAPEMTKSSAQMAEMQTLPTITDKTVVYSCNKQMVTAVYQFENQEPVAAMVSVGDGIIAKILLVINHKMTLQVSFLGIMFGM